MQDLNVLIRVQNDNVYIQFNNEWIPLNPKSIDNSGLDLITVIKLKLIQLEDYS